MVASKPIEFISILILLTIGVTKYGSVYAQGNIPSGGRIVRTELSGETERFETIVKPRQDTRLYRGLKLSNDLKVLLISDPKAETAYVSLTLNSGTMDDPEDVPNLTDAVGLMLINHNRKYPQHFGFQRFLLKESGACGRLPVTSQDKQEFFFKMDPHKLGLALDGFVQSFIHPVPREIVELDVNLSSLTNEIITQVTDEGVTPRVKTVEKALTRKNHPFHNYLNGTDDENIAALDFVLRLQGKMKRERFEKFHSERFSSNIMSLVVLGRENLEDLEKLVVQFEDIQNRKAESNTFTLDRHAWGPNELGNIVYTAPLPRYQLVHGFQLYFRIANIFGLHKIAPWNYITKLVMRRDAGSLYPVLRERGWHIQTLRTFYTTSAGITFFNISITFDDEDVIDYVDEVIEIIFQYIHFMKADGVKEWIFNEHRRVSELRFLLQDPQTSNSYIHEIGAAMHRYPFEDVLSRDTLLKQWDQTVERILRKFLTYLTPENMNILIAGESCKKLLPEDGPTYKIQKVPFEWKQKWKAAKSLPEFQLPSPNEFLREEIYNDFHSKVPQNEHGYHPYRIRNSSISQIWFKQEQKFYSSKVFVGLLFVCPRLNLISSYPFMLRLYGLMVVSTLNHYVPLFEEVKLDMNVRANDYGVEIRLIGYYDTVTIALEELLSRIAAMKQDTNLFEEFIIAKKFYARYMGAETSKREVKAHRYVKYLLSEAVYRPDYVNVMSELKRIKYSSMKKFQSKLLSRIFIQGLIYGNCNEESALKIVNIVESHELVTSSQRVLPQELLPPRTMRTDDGLHLLYNDPELSGNNGVRYYYYSYFQYDKYGDREMGNFLHSIFREDCRKMLGILQIAMNMGKVDCLPVEINDDTGITIRAESTNMAPSILNSTIENFLSSDLRNALINLTSEEFENFKTKTLKKNLKRKDTMQKVFELFWIEIMEKRYYFSRTEAELLRFSFFEKEHAVTFFEVRQMAADYVWKPNSNSLMLYSCVALRWKTPRNVTSEASSDSNVGAGQLGASVKWNRCHYGSNRLKECSEYAPRQDC